MANWLGICNRDSSSRKLGDALIEFTPTLGMSRKLSRKEYELSHALVRGCGDGVIVPR